MLPNILLKNIEKVVDESSTYNELQMIGLLEPYFRDENKIYMYPGAVARKLDISIDQAFILLNRLEKKVILDRLFEFRCPDDNNYKEVFKGISYINLPNEITCKECSEEFPLKDNLYVIYEVKKDYGS